MTYLKKCAGHLVKISKHKMVVAKCCNLAGIPVRGFFHDLSKYNPKEFLEYAKYYGEDRSPVDICKEKNGYCKSWMHHRGHNSHHYEYWIDKLDKGGEPLIMPYKDTVEMICDWIGAGMVYEKSSWNCKRPYEWWMNKKKTAKIHPRIMQFIDFILLDIKVHENLYGSLNKEFTKKWYNKIVIEGCFDKKINE